MDNEETKPTDNREKKPETKPTDNREKEPEKDVPEPRIRQYNESVKPKKNSDNGDN